MDNATFLMALNSSSEAVNGSPSEADEEAAAQSYIQFMNGSRFWIQRVLVPIIVFVGVLGNVATVAVLTRRRMRSSTNVYLTALAASDLLYLVFIFSLSLEHYPTLSPQHIFLHYKRFGLWLTDAASSTSVWLTVSFTVERYIAVCHPMKGKMLCTESRARKVTALVYALCFLATATTPFEWETIRQIKDDGTATDSPQTREHENMTNYDLEVFPFPTTVNGTNFHENSTTQEYYSEQDYEVTEAPTPTYKYTLTYSKLGKNSTYRAVFYWFTSITFVFIPLILLFVFNSFLIHAVHNSRRRRFKMTQGEQSDSSQSQENKITITLIAVVILFVVCQLPTACFLVYDSFAPKAAPSPSKDALLRGLGNIFNFLVAINAASNFLLYCALSGKYRRTFVRTFAPCWAKRWSYFQSTRRRTSVRDRSSSQGSSGALVRRKARRKGGRGGHVCTRGSNRRVVGGSYYTAPNGTDDSCRSTSAPQRTSSMTSNSVPLERSGPEFLSAQSAGDRNGGVRPRLQRHFSAYVTRDNQVNRPKMEIFRTCSMTNRGKRASCSATNSSTSSSTLPRTSDSITTPSSSITKEDSALLAKGTGRSSPGEKATAQSRNGSAAKSGSECAARQNGILSRMRHLRRRLWGNSEQWGSSSSAAVRITISNEEEGARTTV